jgi:hypothetical protein
MAVFGAPSAHEDDPERAVRCGVAIQEALKELALDVRIGVNTGEAVVAADRHRSEGVVGDVVTTASRLEGVAPVGGVLVGEATFRATRGLFDYEPLARSGSRARPGRCRCGWPLRPQPARGRRRPGAGHQLLERHRDLAESYEGVSLTARKAHILACRARSRRRPRPARRDRPLARRLVRSRGYGGPAMTYTADPRVDAYIDGLPDWQQAICREVRELVHAADPEVTETIKFSNRPYFVLEGNICALLAARDHVNVFLYDGAIVPDPEGIITGGHDNQTARTVAVRQGEAVNAPALGAMLRQIIANNRAGGWRKLKRER